MAELQFFKETALPLNPEPSAVYLLASATSPYLDVVVTASSGLAHRRSITAADVQSLISANMAAMNDVTVVPNIPARNALLPLAVVKLVLVQDATGDTTVVAGAAMYLWNPAASSWAKLTEYESLDVTVTWASVSGRPDATPAELDAAVQATNLKSPTFTYSGGNLVGVAYADGSVKTLTYTGSNLVRTDLVRGAVTYRRDFTYSSGALVSVVDSQF